MNKGNILVVDDEPDILEIVGYNLKNEGYKVYTSTNGIEAVKSAEIELTFEPAWEKDMMSEEALLELGMM